MSKSLGNFFTIREVLDRYDSEVLRFFLMSAHYRSPLDFSDQNLNEAEAGMERIYSALAGIEEVLAGRGESVGGINPDILSDAERELLEKTSSLPERFKEAMDDDFNTALAIAHMFDLVRCINRALDEEGGKSSTGQALFTNVRNKVRELGKVLGVFISEPSAYLERIKTRKLAGQEISTAEIENLIVERGAARKSKDFKRSDEIRDYLLSRNIQLLDGAQGTTWKVR
jgi:cysteinyl-tRNA synthetase